MRFRRGPSWAAALVAGLAALFGLGRAALAENATCAGLIEARCLQALGAGVLPADDGADQCADQAQRYIACLQRMTDQPPAPGQPSRDVATPPFGDFGVLKKRERKAFAFRHTGGCAVLVTEELTPGSYYGFGDEFGDRIKMRPNGLTGRYEMRQRLKPGVYTVLLQSTHGSTFAFNLSTRSSC